MAELRELAVDGFETVAHWRDEAADLDALCAVHSTARGPAIGGARWQPYPSLEAAQADVLRLAEAMTYKAAAARLPFGGGKSVIIGDPAAKTDAQLASFAQFVDSFEGRYRTTTDVGTSTADVDQIAQHTPYVVGTSSGSGDTSALTAHGILRGIAATLEALDGEPSAHGRTIVVLGVGKVGEKVARGLAAQGAKLLLADIRAVAAAALAHELGVRTISVDAAPCADADLLSPNALGGLLGPETIPALQTSAVCGGANNQLVHDPADADLLAEHGILYAPDYVVNAGGLISVAQDAAGWTLAEAEAHADGIFETTAAIIEQALRTNQSTAAVARQFALSQLAADAIH